MISGKLELHLFAPRELGEALNGLTSFKVNRLLESKGFQTKHNQGWRPTELGKQHSTYVDTDKYFFDGRPVQQLKWRGTVLPLIAYTLNT